MNFNLLLSNTPRSIFYFNSLIKKKLFPNNIILYGNKNNNLIERKAVIIKSNIITLNAQI